MICPRCGNEWDASKGPCTRCGLVIRLPGLAGGTSASGWSASSPVQQQQKKPSGAADLQQQRSGQLSSFSPGPSSLRGGALNNSGAGGGRMGPSGTEARSPFRASGPLSGSGSFGSGQANSGFGSGFGAAGPLDSSNRRTGPTGFGASNLSRPLSQPGVAGSDAPEAKNPARPGQQRSSLGSGSFARREAAGDSSFTAPSRPGVPSPSRAQVPTRPNRTSGALPQDLSRSQSPLRASRLVTDPLARETPVPPTFPSTPAPSLATATPFPASMPPSAPSSSSGGIAAGALRPLMPGTLLRGGRYRLQELLERQEWLNGVFEATWSGQDAQRAGSLVAICELVIPESSSAAVQSMLRTATMTLSAIGRHPRVPGLLDAFSDQGRNFFVFEMLEGESLLARLRRSGRALPEQEVIECCLQITDILETMAQQTPPLVHGLIRPEHILVARAGSQYLLTNFSIVLAGGATQFISGLDRSRLSPYLPPEFVRGAVDSRTDLYSLLATAYHLVTGSPPTAVSGSIPPAQRLNPLVSSEFEAILSKGLRPIASQRYQRPAELRQDLLALRSAVGGTGMVVEEWPDQSIPLSPRPTSAPAATSSQATPAPLSVPDSVAQALPLMLGAALEEEEQRLLLPRPEDLPPMRESNDTLNAALWVAGILVALIAVVIFARGLF
ncbi:protein kinase [Thermogemmatispora sp.]|uniref:protein kinase domain-containing protein n=1 Tax=Thermogemmatispora sp. TaxID=1968838 RepID=UPI0035E43CAC